MPQIWKSNPHFRLTVGGTNIDDDEALSIQIVRPENSVSHAKLLVNNYESKNYIDLFDPFTQLDISLRYGNDSWTKVFSGMINEVDPQLSEKGEVLGILAWGWEWALLKTLCCTNYGSQSTQASLGDDPQDIIKDIITNYVNKAFGSTGASTQWGLDNTDVEAVLDATAITFMDFRYIDNYSTINRICEIINAYAGSQSVASAHWYVDTEKHLRLKQISADAADGEWDSYWGGTSKTDPGTQTSSTIEVTADMIQYDFRKNIDEYANKTVLCADLRVPGYDYWTESGWANSLWGRSTGASEITLSDCTDANHFIVGNNSLEAQLTAGAGGYFWYPSAQTAAWDFTKIGSKDTIPSLNFYAMRTGAINASIWLWHDAANYFTQNYQFDTVMTDANKWYHFNIPIGPYFATKLETDEISWTTGLGSPNWNSINCIMFYLEAGGGIELHIDDLHFAGKIIREAKDTSEITATKKEHQKIMRCDNAVDDTFKEGTPGTTDVGTAARIAYAELLRRAQTPRVGLIQIPLAVDLLPGQKVHIHAEKQASGTYRINDDFRVVELRHNITERGYTTQLNLTDDVSNTFAFGVPAAYSLLIEQIQGMTHGQARDLKSGNIDPLIPRLAESY